MFLLVPAYPGNPGQKAVKRLCVCVLKCKHGDASQLDMYRGITLSPVLSKLFESVLLDLFGLFLTSSDLQFGLKKLGCSHALFAFNEMVRYFMNNNSHVFRNSTEKIDLSTFSRL